MSNPLLDDATLGMTVEDAVSHLSRICAMQRQEPARLAVQVHNPGAIGPSPKVALLSLASGFDWDAGSVIFKPAQPLTALTPEDVAAIRKSVSQGQSWHAYKAWQKQQERILELEAEILKLTTQLFDAGHMPAPPNQT